MGGKKKGKGKDPRTDSGVPGEERGPSGGAGEGKKSKRRKKDVEDDYDDELAELVNELDLDGEGSKSTGPSLTATDTTIAPEPTAGATVTAPFSSLTTPTATVTTPSTSETARSNSTDVVGRVSTRLEQDPAEVSATSKKSKKKKKKIGEISPLDSEEQRAEVATMHQVEGSTEEVGEKTDNGEKAVDEVRRGGGDREVTGAAAEVGEGAPQDGDKKKKKKKKKVEEEKKASKGPGKAAIYKMQEALEEENLQRNQEMDGGEQKGSGEQKDSVGEEKIVAEEKSAGDGGEITGAAEEMGDDAAQDEDKKKKKKKKKKEEEKKASKGPGKAAISKIKKMQAAIEEEKLRREQEALAAQRAEEEREKSRLEKLSLEKERKERLKQKEKERKQRKKLEGKPVTKKEKEAEIRRLAQLAALEEQGIVVPEKGAVLTEKKKVFYGSRQRSKKVDSGKGVSADVTQDPVEDQSVEGEQEEGFEEESEEGLEHDIEGEEVEELMKHGGVESWEDLESDLEQKDDESSGAIALVTSEVGDDLLAEASSGGGREQQEEEDDEEEEDADSSDTSSEEEESGLSPSERAKLRIQRRRQRHEEERSMDTLRSPVVCVLGHVDTGKTKILDKIRRTNVQDGEAGGITQQIGATFVPVEAIREQTKMLKEFSKAEMVLPGLLIIDTPGHESFSNLRTRGSSMCDLAVLVVDIMHGLEAQTRESLNLLKKRSVPFVVALNKVDRLYDWHRNPNSSIRDTLKKQKQMTRDQMDGRVLEVIREFNEEGLNVAMFWEKVDFKDYLPMVPTSAITGDGMGDLIALLVQHSINNLISELQLSMEVEALVMEVKVIAGLGTTIDVILRNGVLREGDVMVLSGNEGPFVASVRALLMPQPLRELRVKNAYVSHSAVMAAQGIKVTAKGELEKTLPGTNILIPKRQDEIEVLKEEAAVAMKNVLNAIKLQDRGVYVQASTLGSLEALLEFLKQSKIPYSGINIGPVHKRDVMKGSVMLEHDSQWAVILAFDVRIERDAQEMADSLGVKIFSADIIYHLFDSFLKHREELREKNRQLYRSIAVFPCRLRILPNCVFNTRDPIVMGVVVEAGVVKTGTPLTVPGKGFTDIGVVTSLEVNHKSVESVRKGTEVCIKIEPVGGEAPRLYGRHFDHTDMLVSKVSRESIDAIKNYFREDLNKSDWQLIIELKKMFQIM